MTEFELDKARFGGFLAEERKRRGLTQKELARRLFVSDKAVSKWERGLSLPDVSLLIPLAKELEVTVTELLEGRRLEPSGEMEMGQVERLVQGALAFSEKSPEELQKERRRRGLSWLGLVALALLEILVLFRLGYPPDEFVWTLAGVAFGFGCWVHLLAKERLPAYYDENRIGFYSDGFFKLTMPGIAFNNRNWPHILRGIRVWTAAAILLAPALSAEGRRLLGEGWRWWAQPVVLVLFLGGLFLPIYILGRRHEG